jgi:hypothetical protein
MHHKRGKPKRARAGCKLCKPHKQNGQGGDALHASVKRKLQDDEWVVQDPHQQDDLRDWHPFDRALDIALGYDAHGYDEDAA